MNLQKSNRLGYIVFMLITHMSIGVLAQYYGRYAPCPRSYMDPDGDCVMGLASKDYPTYSTIPLTSFSCNFQRFRYIGYYADTQTNCQVYHVCRRDGIKDSFLCPNGTVFNQRALVCDWWFNVNCQDSQKYHNLNEHLYPPITFVKGPLSPNVFPISADVPRLPKRRMPTYGQRLPAASQTAQLVSPSVPTVAIDETATEKSSSTTTAQDLDPNNNSKDFVPMKNPPQTRLGLVSTEDKSFKDLSGKVH